MTLKILGANFGRSGTLSLKFALEQLGFGPCLHMSQFVSESALCRSWQDELNSDRPAWTCLLRGYQATVDWPCCLFVEPLLALMPGVKVIYTERDFDSWFASVSATIFPALSWAKHIPQERRPAFISFAEAIIGSRTFSGNFDRASAQQLYTWHRQRIIDLVPAEQLLLFELQQGWEPLCEFLEVSLPGVAFPNENASGEFFTMLGRMRRR